MCLRFFVGKGYSTGFAAHMAKVKQALETEDPVVCVKEGADGVCEECPNLMDGGCVSGEKPLRYDRGVLEACGVPAGTEMRYSAFSQLVFEKVVSAKRRTEICGDCQWSGLCTEVENTMKK